MKNTQLDVLREEIDSIDNQLLELISKRMKVSKEIGIFKKENNLKPLDSKRWKEVLDSRVKEGTKLDLPPDLTSHLYDVIHRYSILIQNI